MSQLRSSAPVPRKGALHLVDDVRDRVEVVTPDQAAREYASGEAVVLDVREPSEWNAGHIPGSVHIPRGRLELAADPALAGYEPRMAPGRRILVLSSRGLRGVLAAATLREMGYERVATIEGGFQGWVAGRRPVATTGRQDDHGTKGGGGSSDPDPEILRAPHR